MKALLVMCFLMLGSVGVSTPAFAQDLERAYQKEMVYLQSQKRALEARLVDIERTSKTTVGAAQAEVERQQGRLASIGAQADLLEEELRSAERESAGVSDAADALTGMFDQAAASLKRYEVAVQIPQTTAEMTPAEVEKVFGLGVATIREGHTVRRTPGHFFIEDGTKVEGTLIHAGRIATWGVSNDAAGALAPAGEGRLKLWPVDAANTARLAATSVPADGGIFLFETTDKAVEVSKEKTALDIIRAGGVIGWVIVALGVLAGFLIAWRSVVLVRTGRKRQVLIDEVAELAKSGRLAEAQKVAVVTGGAFGRVLADTVACMRAERSKLEDVVSAAILREAPSIERFGSAIMVFAAVSPLLGLLGTVTGMISTFDVITEFGTGDPKMLSGGISEALITTQLGLMVAIPCVLIGNLLNNRANGLVDDLQYGALRVMNADVPGPEHPTERRESTNPTALTEVSA